jgi:hypothetical protein
MYQAWGHNFAKGMHSITITLGFGAVSVPVPLLDFGQVMHSITITLGFGAVSVPLLDFGQVMQYITITWTK